MPQSGQEVPDDLDARLVVLSVDHICTKEPGSAAEIARVIRESRGNTACLYRNTLVFLAADKTRLQVRRKLRASAWLGRRSSQSRWQ
jgi:hypothetical protein